MLDLTKKRLDAFLSKTPNALKKMQDMVAETKEFPSRQLLIYNLMCLTNDVSTFDTELINYLAEDRELANLIIEKAKLNSKIKRTNVNAAQLRQSIKRLGYGFIHNEAQFSLAKEYVKIYYANDSTEVKVLIKRSIRLAFLAKELAAMIGFPETALVFFAGINYYIGDLILALREPKIKEEIERMKQKGVDSKGAELTLLGFDSSELAAKKLQEWNLPNPVIDLVRNNHNISEVNSSNYKAAMLMKFAEYVSNGLANKKSGPNAMWDKAYEYLCEFGVAMNIDGWGREIKLIYIKLLETEHMLFQRK